MVVGGILANDLGLIGDDRDTRHGRDDIFDVMAPVTGGTFTGRWNPPNDRGARRRLQSAVGPARSDICRHYRARGLGIGCRGQQKEVRDRIPPNQGPNLPYVIARM